MALSGVQVSHFSPITTLWRKQHCVHCRDGQTEVLTKTPRPAAAAAAARGRVCLPPGCAPSVTMTAPGRVSGWGGGRGQAGTATDQVLWPLQPLPSWGLRTLTTAQKDHGACATLQGDSRTDRLWGARGTSLDLGHFHWTQTRSQQHQDTVSL